MFFELCEQVHCLDEKYISSLSKLVISPELLPSKRSNSNLEYIVLPVLGVIYKQNSFGFQKTDANTFFVDV